MREEAYYYQYVFAADPRLFLLQRVPSSHTTPHMYTIGAARVCALQVNIRRIHALAKLHLKRELDQDCPLLCTRKVLVPRERDRREWNFLKLRSTEMEVGGNRFHHIVTEYRLLYLRMLLECRGI